MKSRRCKSWCWILRTNIEGGSTLHESLAKHPLYFDDLFVNLVEAGEHAGALETSAGQNRDLQGENRSAKEENQKGAVLSRGGLGCRSHCLGDSVDFCDPAV